MEPTGTLVPQSQKRESLIICVPYGGYMDPRMTDSLFVAALIAEKSGLDVQGITHTWRKLIHTSRNDMADEFLTKSAADWSLWVDSDMVLPPNAIIKMWRWAKILKAYWMTGVYYQRYPPHDAVLYRLPPRSQRHDDDHRRFMHEHVAPTKERKQPFEVDCAGFGCMLIHRRVFESVGKPYFTFVDDEVGGNVASEDFHFSVKARQAGFLLYAVPEVECGHIPEGEPVTRTNFDAHKKAEEYIEIKEVYSGVKKNDGRNDGNSQSQPTAEKTG